MSIKKKILIGLAALPVLLILYLIVNAYIVSPIQDSYDKLRFDELSSKMKKVYNEVLATAGDKEEWKYETSCRDASDSEISFGEDGYTCKMRMSTIAIRTDIGDTDKLHQKYYPVISALTFITPRERLQDDFYEDAKRGELLKDAFISYSSSIDKTVYCGYFINGDTLGGSFGFYGSPDRLKDLDDNTEVSLLYFECEIHSNKDWYNILR
jgi:hypothetical protein